MNDQLTIHNQALCQKPPKKAPSAGDVDPRGLFHQQPASSPKIYSQKIHNVVDTLDGMVSGKF